MMAAEAGFLPPVGVSCADMKFGMVTVSDGKTKPQPVSYRKSYLMVIEIVGSTFNLVLALALFPFNTLPTFLPPLPCPISFTFFLSFPLFLPSPFFLPPTLHFFSLTFPSSLPLYLHYFSFLSSFLFPILFPFHPSPFSFSYLPFLPFLSFFSPSFPNPSPLRFAFN